MRMANFPERKRQRQIRAWQREQAALTADTPEAPLPDHLVMEKRGVRTAKRRMTKRGKKGE